MSRRYHELPPPPDLASWARCVWMSSRPGPAEPRWVVPDGCLDVIWIDGELIVAGPDDAPNLHRPRPTPRPVAVVGVRFRPGRAAPLLRDDPSRLRNQRVAYSALGRPATDGLVERLAATDRPADALRLLVDEVRSRAAEAGPPDPVGAGAADLLEVSGGRLALGDLSGALGVSERHLRRRATAALGYGPKTFARIVRFQRALTLVQAGQPLATVAASAGYADQAHLTREVSALAGRPPGALRPVADGRFVQDDAGVPLVRLPA